MRKALIILPTYNEAENLKTLIPAIFKQQEKLSNWQINILVVDSFSKDNTEGLLKEFQKKYKGRFFYILRPKEGLGKAYYEGFSYAREKIKPFVVFEMDADWSHDPKKIPEFLKEIEKGADFVIGSRYTKGGSIPKDWAFHRKLFSVLGNIIIRFGFAKPSITDWTSGFRAIRIWVINKLLEEVKGYNSYVFQVALLDKTIKLGARVKEVPIQFKDREKGRSKINSFQYIVHTLTYTFLNSSFIRFFMVGLSGFVVDFSTTYILITFLKLQKPLASALGGEIAIINNFIFHNFWSFSHKRIKGGIFTYLKNFVKFNLIAIGNVIIQYVGMYLALKIFGDFSFSIFNFSIYSWMIYKIAIIALVVIPYSYILYNKVIWKK